jgi:hypothetical protein
MYQRFPEVRRFVRPSVEPFKWVLLACLALGGGVPARADSDPAHRASNVETPVAWPGGIIPYDVSRLTAEQQPTVQRAMQRWMDTGARIAFVPHTTQVEYVNFTGKTDAGNNTSQTGFKRGSPADINITAFWWRQGEWMPVHELGHVLGFHHEHARWDRDQYITVHYEHIKPGRSGDYDWISKTNWLVNNTPYDYFSVMHYRVCWASACESQCRDGDGSSPCAVIDPVGTNFDAVIGQWDRNGISAGDKDRARRAYGQGQTVYLNLAPGESGAGALDKPYRDLALARRQSPPNSRLILLKPEGGWALVEPH